MKIFALRSQGIHLLSEDEVNSEYARNMLKLDTAAVIEEIYVPPFEQSIEGVVVGLDEEYGYRYWVWESGMTRDELKDFFRNISTATDWAVDRDKLPGKLHAAELIRGGMITFDRERPDDERMFRYFQGVKAHLHQQDDSWIKFEDDVEQTT